MEELAALPEMAATPRRAGVRLLVADDDPRARSLLGSGARDTTPRDRGTRPQHPRPDGIEAAMTLRELQPRIRLALQPADPLPHSEHAHAVLETRSEPASLKRNLTCTACGYGIARSTPPDRCPMCQTEDGWAEARRRTPIALSAG